MSNRYEYSQVNASAQVTNESASADIITNPGSAVYICIERVVFSVYEAAVGGGGICELKDTNGNVIYTINVDGVKDVTLDFGDDGLKKGPGVGLQAALSGASVKQASVSVAVSGHLTFRA